MKPVHATLPVFALLAGFAAGFAAARSPWVTTKPAGARFPAMPSRPGTADVPPSFEAPAANPAREIALAAARPASPAAFAADFEKISRLGDDGRRRRLLDRLLQKAVLAGAPETAGFVLALQDEETRKEALLRVMQAWSVQDPEAALAWTAKASFNNDRERGMAMAMICTQVARADPPEALRLALAHGVEALAEGLDAGLTARWAETDLPAARDWVLSLPAGSQRDRLVESLALVAFDRGPAKAAEVILEHIPDGESQDRALLALVDRLARQNPAKAQAWVASFPEGALRERGMNTVEGILGREAAGE